MATKYFFKKQIKDESVQVPVEIIRENKYDLTDLEMYIYLYLLFKKDNKTNISNTSIKSLSNILYGKYDDTKKKNLKRILVCLKKKGLIEINHSPNDLLNSKNTYILNLDIHKNSEYELIPKDIFLSKKIKWREKLFNIRLYSLVLEDEEGIYCSTNKIANLLNLSFVKTQKYLNYLQDKEIVRFDSSMYLIDFFRLFDIF